MACEADHRPGTPGIAAAAWRIVVAAGGTGGHIYPGVAVARRFQERCPGTDVMFVGHQGGIEERIIPREGFRLQTVMARPLKGRTRLEQMRALGVVGLGTFQALWFLQRWRPHLVIGAGGYVMGPVLLAATLLRIPRVLMEQNLVPGFTVRALARCSQQVFTSFPESMTYLAGRPVACTGTPIRQDICEVQETRPGEGPQRQPAARLHLLIFGGSQGAHRINQAVMEALPLLVAQHAQIRIAHQTGDADYADVCGAYKASGIQAEVQPFFHDMGQRYRWADLVLCRAGASTLAELTACGKPAILVPYPYAADDHQRHNALALERQGAAQVIADAELTGKRLYEAVLPAIQEPGQLQQQAANSRRLGHPQAADEIITACLHLLGHKAA